MERLVKFCFGDKKGERLRNGRKEGREREERETKREKEGGRTGGKEAIKVR